MSTYLIKRLIALIAVTLCVSILVFLSLYLTPGDPLTAILGDAVISSERAGELRQEYGFDDPLYIQYFRFLERTLRGDLGDSLQYKRPVLDEIIAELPATIKLTMAAITVALILGVPLGIVAAIHQNTWVDSVSMLLALGGVSIPSFWLGLMLLLIFSLALGWLPATGTEGGQRLIMPALTLGYGSAAIIARLTRSSMLDVLHQAYITTAYAKGLARNAVVLRHALRNAIIPVITIVGLQLGNLLAGSVVVETIFSRQGLGRMLVGAILAKDFPLAQGTVLFIAVLYSLINLMVDVSYVMVDPRIRY